MAERAKSSAHATPLARARTFGGTATVTARQRLGSVFSRESLLRLLLSFFLATALWLYITSKQNPALSIDYPQALPVSTTNLNPGLLVTNTLAAVRVRVRLENQNIPITPASFHPYVNLVGVGPGVHRLAVKVAPDPGIQIERITPSRIPVVVVQSQQKLVPVRVHILAPPPEGYTQGTIRIQPTHVTVSGSKPVVSQVAQAGTYIDLSQVQSSLQGSYPLSPENSQGGTVTGHLPLSPSSVSVIVSVKSLSSYKTLPVLVPVSGRPRAGIGIRSLTVSPPTITATGPPTQLSAVTSVSTWPIYVSRRGASTFTSRVRLRLHHGIDSTTRSVRVTVTLATVASSSSIQVAPTPINVAAGLTAHIRPARIQVTVAGPSTAIRNAARNMRATVNLAGDGVGTFQIKPTVSAPHDLRIEGIFPNTVTVTLTAG